MKVFVTGATGFIGQPLVAALLAGGHQVRGMARSEAGMAQLRAQGAAAFRGDLNDVESLRAGADGMDTVVHLAFNHDDMSQFAASGAAERRAIQALGEALAPGKALVVTSGVGLTQATPGQPSTEQDPPRPNFPRNPEAAAGQVFARGIQVAVVRLPQVHDTHKQGLITYLLKLARETGVSAYVGEGSNCWAAAPLADVVDLYRRVVEHPRPGYTVYNAVQEQGVSLREIAEALSKGLGLPTRSLEPAAVEGHFGWLAHFAAMDIQASSAWTQQALDWSPQGPGLLADLRAMDYSR